MSRKTSGVLLGIKKIYEEEYKKLLIIPFLILVLALVQIGYQTATTGDFINKGVSLKGGVTMSVYDTSETDTRTIQSALEAAFPDNDFVVRAISNTGVAAGVIVEADLEVTDDAAIEKFKEIVGGEMGVELTVDNHNIEFIGSSLGKSFFSATIKAVLIAFLLMGLVVFIYFRTLAPSLAVILAAFSDIVVTIAIVNLLDIQIGTAGIAAFLMMIGYSVDTDILLSVRVLKKKDGSVMERVYDAMKTGVTMNITTMVALVIALVFSPSEVIRQIMIILLIGLAVDLINTWIQNTGILRLYLERK
ncbi:protein translocase subunit SecF [Candidatus Woesearchaeota archaeon]|nr:protein translocase subunit SecF [Candidatus Woesearchaeota archaeon]